MLAALLRLSGKLTFCLTISLLFGRQESISAQQSAETRPQSNFPKLEFRKWSGDINVPDPVSVSVDDRGRVYASQTRRRKIQDLDIREHYQWVPDDVALSSVEEKRAFLKEKLAIGGDQENQRRHVQDLNGDGQHDWRDLKVISEAIYELRDTDNDGTADRMTVFAEDFKTEVTGIAAGVLAHDGSVWATIAPDVWKLTDTDNDGQADQRQVMAHGFGIHIAYAGHDMHGLTVGPDGKIYWSIGDKGINVKTADGRNIAYPNQGGVMRCNPDGTDFEVFAHGLRNVQELAFDKYGNLFGVDNDADQPNEKERFVYIVNGMDAGWRCNYQYRNNQYNPWVNERLWDLPGDQHPAYIVPPLGHYVDGPAGFVYNPGTALSPAYYDYFFLTSAPNGQQYAFRAQPVGDSFQMVDQHQIGSGIAIVGWNWGPDGALYGADWDGGYPLDQKGSVVRIDTIEGEDAIRSEVRKLLYDGFSERSNTELATLLAHPDQRVRLHAQFALVDRQQIDSLEQIALSAAQTPVTRIHAIWGLGQLSRNGVPSATATIASLFKDQDHHVRGQAVKTYGELRDVDGRPILPLLKDENLHVRTLAANALARQPVRSAVPALLEQAAGLTPNQHYLRHACSWALSQCATDRELEGNVHSTENVMQRLCCILALRHQRSPQIATYLNDVSDWIATEAARGIHDDRSIPESLPALAEALLSRSDQTEAFSRRAINANFRIGTAEAAQRVVTFATNEAHPVAIRLEAIDTLNDWNDHNALDRVDGRNRHLSPRQLDSTTIADPLSKLVGSEHPEIRTASLLTAQRLGVPLADEMLKDLVRDDQLDDALRAAALKTLAARNSRDDLPRLCADALNSKSRLLRQQAITTLCRIKPSAGLRAAESLIRDRSEPLLLRQISLRLLADIPESKVLLETLWDEYQSAMFDNQLALDLYETIQQNPQLPEPVGIEPRLLARDGGDVARGELLFRTHQQAQCSRCHRVGRNGSDIGPELSQIGSLRDADYILRAINDPSADIDDKYRTQLYLLDSGKLLKGVPVSHDQQKTTIADSQGNEIVIPNDEILETKVQTVSLMPAMDDTLTAAEIRDLVAYLRSLKRR